MDNATRRLLFDVTVWTCAVLTLFALLIHEATAGSHADTATNDKWQAECSTCHVAYPPQLLPASSWRRIMSGLGKHFGTDASLDAQADAEIGSFLEQHAATGKRERAGGDTLRITETAWFQREHRKVATATWKHPGVKTPANCAGCHTAAEQGDYGERNIRLPR